MGSRILGVGITGKTLTDLERRMMSESPPYAVILFARNVGEAAQLKDLVAEIKALSPEPPVIMIDQEGGRVDRLRNLFPGLPPAEALLEVERPLEFAYRSGYVMGKALRYFDIEINLAPVVDIRREIAAKGLERRTFGSDADTVIALAGEFMRGQHAAGVASCLKHFPGLGRAFGDPHYGISTVNASYDELVSDDLLPYLKLGDVAGGIMIGHGSYPQIEDPEIPATLSKRIATDMLRRLCEFHGVAVSDDMEMHAVADLGSYEDLAVRAMMAGNDVVMFCSHIERIPAVMAHVRQRAREDAVIGARFIQAVARADFYRAHSDMLRFQNPPRHWTYEELRAESDQFVEEFNQARLPEEAITPADRRRASLRSRGTGRTGREEWT
jgi:beta-N-acetylhexosaminidase